MAVKPKRFPRPLITSALVACLLLSPGYSCLAQGENKPSESQLLQSLAVQQERCGKDSLEVMKANDELALFYFNTKQYAKAVPFERNVLAFKEKHYGPNALETSVTCCNLANRLSDIGELTEAEHLFTRAYEIIKSVKGPYYKHCEIPLQGRRAIYENQKKYQLAEADAKTILSIREKRLPDTDPEIIEALRKLNSIYKNWGKIDQLEIQRRLLSLIEKRYGDSPELADALTEAGMEYERFTLDEPEYLKNIESFYERALRIRMKISGPDHVDTIESMKLLAKFYGNKDKAGPYLVTVFEMCKKKYGVDDSRTIKAFTRLVTYHCDRSEFQQSDVVFDKFMDSRVSHGSPIAPELARICEEFKSMQLNKGRYARACEIHEKFLATTGNASQIRAEFAGLTREMLKDVASDFCGYLDKRTETEHQSQFNQDLLQFYRKLRSPEKNDISADGSIPNWHQISTYLKPCDGDLLAAVCMLQLSIPCNKEFPSYIEKAIELQKQNSPDFVLGVMSSRAVAAAYLVSIGNDPKPIVISLKKELSGVRAQIDGKSESDKRFTGSLVGITGGIDKVQHWLDNLTVSVACLNLCCDDLYEARTDTQSRFSNVTDRGYVCRDTTALLKASKIASLAFGYTMARRYLNKAIEYARQPECKDPTLLSSALLESSKLEFELSSFDRSMSDAIQTLNSKHVSERTKLEALVQIVRCQVALCEIDSKSQQSDKANKQLVATVRNAKETISTIEQSRLGSCEVLLGQSYYLLGSLFQLEGDLDEALQWIDRSIQSLSKSGDSYEKTVALADAYSLLGIIQLSKFYKTRDALIAQLADQNLQESIRLRNFQVSPDKQLLLARTMVARAVLLKLQQKDKDSGSIVQDVAQILDDFTVRLLNNGTFTERYTFSKRINEISAQLLALGNSSPEFSTIYNHMLKWKGLLVEGAAMDSRLIAIGTLHSKTPLEKLRSNRTKILESVLTFSNLNSENRRKLIDAIYEYDAQKSIHKDMGSLQSELIIAEEHLIALLKQKPALIRKLYPKGKVEEQESKPQPFQEVKSALEAEAGDRTGKTDTATLISLLSSDEAFIDFYTYAPIQLNGQQLYDESHYCAIVLTKNSAARFVDLGRTAKVDSDTRAWLSALSGHSSGKREVGGIPEDSSHSAVEVDRLQTSVSQELWKPLESILTSSNPSGEILKFKKLWICPEAELANIPWSLLIPATFKDVLISQIDSARELYDLRSPTNIDQAIRAKIESNKTALLVGDIDFGNRSLKFSGPEVSAIDTFLKKQGFQTTLLTKELPTKESIYTALTTPRICHFATHGFFSESVYSGQDSQRSRQRSGPQRSKSKRDVEFQGLASIQNPFFQSGICLASSDTKRSKQFSGGLNASGFMSAEDIVGLDLRNCDLLTLSACQTARGAAYTGQGVIGLRSAIMAAGARSMLMSLWSVDDEATCEFMKIFYKKLLSGETTMTKARALAETQKEIRNMPGKNWHHPYYWAAWTLIGEGF